MPLAGVFLAGKDGLLLVLGLDVVVAATSTSVAATFLTGFAEDEEEEEAGASDL